MAIHKSKEQKEAEVTPGYVNRKMESMMSALFDTIEDFERRVKNLEQQVLQKFLQMHLMLDLTQRVVLQSHHLIL